MFEKHELVIVFRSYLLKNIVCSFIAKLGRHPLRCPAENQAAYENILDIPKSLPRC